MKQFQFYKHFILWSALLVAAVFAPRLALSGEACESTASASLKTKSVAIEMAVINGEISELEVAGKKEGLLQQVKLETEKCRRLISAAKAPTARAQSSSF